MAIVLARKSLVSLLMFIGLVGIFEGITQAQECDATYSAELKGTGDTYEIVAFGDSVMWGQGLKLEDKFTYQVAQWTNQQGSPVRLRSYAHSGASIDDHGGAHHVTPGEVPNDFPYILKQITCVPEADRKQIKLILVDGCANDFAVSQKLLESVGDPTLWDGWYQWVDKWAKHYCLDSMSNLLTHIQPM